jgi:hypothetical protein
LKLDSHFNQRRFFIFSLLTFLDLVNVDGTVAAYRLPYLLLGNSAVLKQESAYFEHFYPRLEPFRHFIPLKRDLSDLIEKIKWAKNNDEKVAEIVEAANQVAEEETAPVKVLWSWISLLKVKHSQTGLGNLSTIKQAIKQANNQRTTNFSRPWAVVQVFYSRALNIDRFLWTGFFSRPYFKQEGRTGLKKGNRISDRFLTGHATLFCCETCQRNCFLSFYPVLPFCLKKSA